jgi:hypothetical protein
MLIRSFFGNTINSNFPFRLIVGYFISIFHLFWTLKLWIFKLGIKLILNQCLLSIKKSQVHYIGFSIKIIRYFRPLGGFLGGMFGVVSIGIFVISGFLLFGASVFSLMFGCRKLMTVLRNELDLLNGCL